MSALTGQIPAAKLPTTNFFLSTITLSDSHPVTKQSSTFTFPRQMIADPLTSEGPAGWEPDAKASWWPYFQQRHKTVNLFWVQGHMLNHLLHGPGTPNNLVPISNTLNTNMSALVEEIAKALVGKGKVLRYVVTAHWDGHRSSKGATELDHPRLVRETYGLKGIKDTNGIEGTLLWGEQFAPTRLSWELYEKSATGALTPVALSDRTGGSDQWMNHYPS